MKVPEFGNRDGFEVAQELVARTGLTGIVISRKVCNVSGIPRELLRFKRKGSYELWALMSLQESNFHQWHVMELEILCDGLGLGWTSIETGSFSSMVRLVIGLLADDVAQKHLADIKWAGVKESIPAGMPSEKYSYN